MIEYVLNAVTNKDNKQFVLIKKNRPEFLKGLYSFVGGKIEDNETSYDAAKRETLEECGLATNPIAIGQIIGDDYKVYVFHSPVHNIYDAQTMEDEDICIFNIHTIADMDYKLADDVLAICFLIRNIQQFFTLEH